ncbi:MAG: HigA family addiction module antidote protein [Caldilineaceae bacterium]|nr:HigA family addiction module antidote protein [Caldilineaceae bacterium]
MTKKKIPYQPEIITPPGETVAELLDERGMTQTELAQRMGRPVKTINEIIHGKAAIVPETALQLERVFGVPAEYWLNHEAKYRASLLRQNEEARYSGWYNWLDKLPIKELKDLGKLSPIRNHGKNKNLLVCECLEFFGVATPDEWKTVYGNLQIAYRQSMPEQSDPYARAAWLRLGELQAAQMPTARYDQQRFVAALQEIRGLTTLPPEEFQLRLNALLAEAGVVLALVPAIPRARVSGAARWINQRPVIQLSLFGKTNDRFWFTLFHEACHILKHERKLVYVDNDLGADITEVEREADHFATEILIPSQYASDLSRLRSKEMVRDFADLIGVHPGIVVGRLQHEKHIDRSWMNDLKDTFEWKTVVAA